MILVLTAPSPVRYLLLDERLLEGVGGPAGQDGGVGEQGRHPQARGHDYWHDFGVMVHMGTVCITWGRVHWATSQNPTHLGAGGLFLSGGDTLCVERDIPRA